MTSGPKIHREFIAVCSHSGQKGYSAEVEKREKGDYVDQVGNSALAEMTEALEKASANLSSTSVTEPGLMQLSELADQVGASSFIGRIALAGQTNSGSY